jgi:hypothetical protein
MTFKLDHYPAGSLFIPRTIGHFMLNVKLKMSTSMTEKRGACAPPRFCSRLTSGGVAPTRFGVVGKHLPVIYPAV